MYPDCAVKGFVVNASLVFRGAWACIKPFIDKKAVQKVAVHGKNFQEDLFTYIHPDNVPTFLGGNCRCEHIEGGCCYDEPGPWNTFKGDKWGEAAREQLRQKKLEVEKEGSEYESDSEEEEKLDIVGSKA